MDIYTDVKNLFPELKKIDKSEYVTILDEDIKFSISSGEALMKIRHHLKALNSETGNSFIIKAKCKDILKDISTLLE